MKINPRICLTKQQEEIPCICLKTGIASALVAPQLPKDSKGKAFVFEYIHPLSYWSNAQGIVKAGRGYIEKLESQVLAGLVLTTYEHYSLLDKYELSAVEANAILCTASNDSLIELLCLAGLFTDKNTESAPALSLEWKDLRYAQTIDSQLLDYIKALKAEFISPVREETDISLRRIQILNASAQQGKNFKNGVQLLSARASLANHDKEFETVFKSAKREIKELISLTSSMPAKTLAFLQIIASGRNLVSLDQEIRKNLCSKLNALGTTEASRIATLIQSCYNPYDIFAKADEGLDRASDSFAQQKPKSLKEILEAKKAAKEGISYCVAREPKGSGGATQATDTNNIDNKSSESSEEAFDEEVEDLLDFIPEEALDDNELNEEEEDGLEDTFSRFTNSLYTSKDF